MNEAELIAKLKTDTKSYQNIMHQGYFSNCMFRYETGRLKPSTLTHFLNSLGYIKENDLWVKIENFKSVWIHKSKKVA